MSGGDVILGVTTRGMELAASVTLSVEDRRKHVHLTGASGSGKSTLLLSSMEADLSAGRSFALLDPHGDLASTVIASIPGDRINDVRLIDPTDEQFPAGFNPLFNVPICRRSLVAAQMTSAFSRIWGTSIADAPRMTLILLHSLRLLLDVPHASLILLPRFFSSADFRDTLLHRSTDVLTRSFWLRDFPTWPPKVQEEALVPVSTRITYLLADPTVRNLLAHSTIDLHDVMRRGRILIARLPRGLLGEGPAHLIGAMLITLLSQAAEARAALPEAERRDYAIYIDELEHFVVTESMATFYAEARKWRTPIVSANQTLLGQVPERLRQILLSNVGTLVAFRSSAEDSQHLAGDLGLQNPLALTDLANHRAFARVIEDGTPISPIYLTTLPYAQPSFDSTDAVRARARARHTRPRAIVDREIEKQLGIPNAGCGCRRLEKASVSGSRPRRRTPKLTMMPMQSGLDV